MDLGERKSPSSDSDLRESHWYVEPLSDARTKLADFFSILLTPPHKDALVSEQHHGMLRDDGWLPHTAPIL